MDAINDGSQLAKENIVNRTAKNQDDKLYLFEHGGTTGAVIRILPDDVATQSDPGTNSPSSGGRAEFLIPNS